MMAQKAWLTEVAAQRYWMEEIARIGSIKVTTPRMHLKHVYPNWRPTAELISLASRASRADADPSRQRSTSAASSYQTSKLLP